MRKVGLILGFSFTLLAQQVFATSNTTDSFKDRPCAALAKVCLTAGYTRSDEQGKRFWFDCMKPLLLGQTVKGTSATANEIKICRMEKIKAMKADLKALENVK